MFSFRYNELLNARNALISACGFIQNKNVVFLQENFDDCYRVLKSSHVKGQFIEQFVACPAWSPSLSIESTDNDIWKGLQSQFKKIFTKLPWKENLPVLIEKNISKIFLASKNVENIQIRELICHVMFELVFQKEALPSQVDLFCKASIEWSKEIGMRGEADSQVKKDFWLELSSLVEERFPQTASLSQKEKIFFVSSLAQPFFISPMINFSDIYASTGLVLHEQDSWKEWLKKQQDTNAKPLFLHFMLECIRIHHPFPIFEREMLKELELSSQTLKKGTQVFILIDSFQMDKKIQISNWNEDQQHIMKSFIFGAGARACLGQQMAELLLTEITWHLIKKNIPLENLRLKTSYSGRLNDHETIPGETLYQLKKAVKILQSSYQIRKQQKTTCPYQHVTERIQSF